MLQVFKAKVLFFVGYYPSMQHIKIPSDAPIELSDRILSVPDTIRYPSIPPALPFSQTAERLCLSPLPCVHNQRLIDLPFLIPNLIHLELGRPVNGKPCTNLLFTETSLDMANFFIAFFEAYGTILFPRLETLDIWLPPNAGEYRQLIKRLGQFLAYSKRARSPLRTLIISPALLKGDDRSHIRESLQELVEYDYKTS